MSVTTKRHYNIESTSMCIRKVFGMIWKVVTSPSISKSVTFESFPKH